VVGCTIGSRGEVPEERKPVMVMMMMMMTTIILLIMVKVKIVPVL
jgi:hypothetical protein